MYIYIYVSELYKWCMGRNIEQGIERVVVRVEVVFNNPPGSGETF